MIHVVLAMWFVFAVPETLVTYHTSAYRCLCTRRNCTYTVVRRDGARRDTLEIGDFDYEPSRSMPWPAHLSRLRKVEGKRI